MRLVVTLAMVHVLLSSVVLVSSSRCQQTDEGTTDEKASVRFSDAPFLAYSLPVGFTETDSIPNDEMEYDHAMKWKGGRLETRFALRPISQDDLEAYREWVEKGRPQDRIMTDPNSWFPYEFNAIALNIAGSGSVVEPEHFALDAVATEFGADAGMYTVIQDMSSDFAGDYTNCMMVGIHKKDVGQAYIFHLYNDFDGVQQGIELAFHALRFVSEDSSEEQGLNRNQ